MGTWLWFFRKWRVEDGKAVPDPVYLESHAGARAAGGLGRILTPQGAFTFEEFLSGMLGKPVTSLGRDVRTIKDGELDTEIANWHPGTVHALYGFLEDEGVRLGTYVDHTDGLPAFGLYKLQRQKQLLEKLKEGLAGWRKREDDQAREVNGLIEDVVHRLGQGYRLGITE